MALNVLVEIAEVWKGLSPLVRGLFETAIIIVLAVLLRASLLNLIKRRSRKSETYYLWRKITQYVATFIVLGLIASIWFSGTTNIATFLGLLTAGVAVSLKDPLANVAAWAFMLIQRPFSVGDRIEIDGLRGDVIDESFMVFTLIEVGNWVHGEQSTGRLIHIPNAMVFQKSLFNYTQEFGFIWDEIDVTVTFESDWVLAKQILDKIAREHAKSVVPEAERELKSTSRKTLIQYQNFWPIVYTDVAQFGVLLSVRYLVRARQRRGERQAMWEDILHAIAAEPHIHLAYPAQRVLFSTGSGADLDHTSPATKPQDTET